MKIWEDYKMTFNNKTTKWSNNKNGVFQNNNKMEQKKVQYNFDKHTAKISILSSGNVGKYEFLNWQRCFSRKRLVKKGCYNQKICIFAKRQRVDKAN